MTDDIRKASRYTTIGVDSDYSPNWGIRLDEFVPDLRGERGLKRLREMATNDPIVGALLSAMDLMIRSTPWRIEGGSDEANELTTYCLHNLEDATFEMFLSDVLSFLPFGFSVFEVIARRPAQHPRGWVTLRRLAPRAQWTIDRFQVDRQGRIEGVYQTSTLGSGFIPYAKLLHFRTASKQNDPAGVSVLRAAYQPWYFARRIQEIEAVAIERELNGLPLFRIPSEYLSPDATDEQKALVNMVKQIGRDVKRNEQGYIIIPSDPYESADGKMSDIRMVDFELVASQGKRDIDTSAVIIRYQQDMARSALADFVMLGTNDRGSFALSKSKADLFLKALEGYLDAIASVLNRQLVPTLMRWNGMNEEDAPKIMHGRVAPTDLAELGAYLHRIRALGLNLMDEATEDFLRNAAGLPPALAREDRPHTETALPDPDAAPAPAAPPPPADPAGDAE